MISVIIPTFNRAQFLKATLQSVSEQNFDGDSEVIVIDNGSTDGTAGVCKAFSNVLKGFNYHYDATPGLLTGRHKGWQMANGDILAFIDDDVELTSGWLNGIKASFSDDNVALVTGPCLPGYETTPPDWLNFFWDHTPYGGKMCTWLSLLDLGKKIIQVNPNYVWGVNFSIRKNVLANLGGFHPDCIPTDLQQYQGDGETGLTMKAEKAGLIALYNPAVMLYHKVPSQRTTLAYFEKRAFYQGVCNSFTDIRNANFSGDDLTPSNPSPTRLAKRILQAVKRRLTVNLKQAEPENIVKLKQDLSAFVTRGYQFHQDAFKNDDTVKKWVLKPDYLLYNLPTHD